MCSMRQLCRDTQLLHATLSICPGEILRPFFPVKTFYSLDKKLSVRYLSFGIRLAYPKQMTVVNSKKELEQKGRKIQGKDITCQYDE